MGLPKKLYQRRVIAASGVVSPLGRNMGKILVTSVVVLLCGCASSGSNQSFGSYVEQLPPVQPGMARIVLYRTVDDGEFGSDGWWQRTELNRPDVKINSTSVGDLRPGDFKYVDQPAGNQAIVLKNDPKCVYDRSSALSYWWRSILERNLRDCQPPYTRE